MEQIFRFLLNYKIKYLVPVLLAVGMFISTIGVFFSLNYIVSFTIEKYIHQGMISYKNLILATLEKNSDDFISNEYNYISNSIYHFFILEKNTNTVMLSDNQDIIQNNLKEILEKNSLYKFQWKDILSIYANMLETQKNFFKIDHNFFYVFNLDNIHNDTYKDKLLIISYSFNWMDLLNFKSIITLIFVLVIIIFIPFLFFLYVYNRFYQVRIDFLTESIQKIMNGDLSVRVPIIGNDEISEISKLINQMKEELKENLYEDPLTKALNRKGFEVMVNKLLDLNKYYAIFFMDLDGFKYINETFGHTIGDRALQMVVQLLRNLIYSNFLGAKMLLGRIGGDEFSLFIDLQNLKDSILDIQIFALKIIEEISKPYILDNINLHLGVSIGIALYPDHGRDLNELLTNADLAMYQIKYSTKNSYYIFDSKLKSQYEKKHILRNELIKIYKNNQIKDYFFLVFQPIYNIKSDQITHIEVLLRFYHQSIQANISDVLYLLEDLNYIVDISKYVIKNSLLDLIDIQNQSSIKLHLSINLSYDQLIDKMFYRDLKKIFLDLSRENKIVEESQIIFEITETIFMKDVNKVVRIMNSLHDLGFSFAIDDFGTGYSSLGYLKNLPIDYLKIDKSFIDDVVINPRTESILRSILNLANMLNLKTIIEGVEDPITFKKLLLEFNCDFIQGYYISPPLKKNEIIHFLKKPIFYNLNNK